jgi:hypothetical protein
MVVKERGISRVAEYEGFWSRHQINRCHVVT